MLNNFIYAQTKDLFLEALDAGQVLDEAIVFIEDTKEIWNRGTYFGSGELDSNVLNDIQLEISQLKDTKLDKSGLTAYALKTDLKNYLLSSTADSTYAKASTLDTFKEGITNRVQTLENWYTITDTDATDEAINRWKDVESFLSGIKDTENLDSILNGIYDSISSKASSADLSNYLSLSGGTIKGTSPYNQYILTLDTDNVYYTIFRLNNQGVQKGYLAWADDAYFEGIFISNTTTNDVLGLSDSGVPMYNKNTLIHSGNAGTYVPLRKARQSTIDLNTAANGFYEIGYTGQTLTNAPSGIANALFVDLRDSNGLAKMQFVGASNSHALFFRADQSTGDAITSDWKQIAFTDSNVASADYATSAGNADTLDGYHADIMVKSYVANADNFTKFTDRSFFQTAFVSGQGDFGSLVVPTGSGNTESRYYTTELRFDNGSKNPKIRVTDPNGTSDWYTLARTVDNVASATKLQTSRTIGGQSFDGTGDMSGNLNLGKAAIGHSFSDTWTDENDNTHPWHGLDFTHISTGATLSSYYGLTFKVGAGQMLINSSGNVGIGTTSPQYKLDVNGSFNATSGNIGGNAIATQTWVNNSSNGALAWASYTTATTVASVPIGYKIVKCTVSASGSFSLASTSITAGREIHVIVNNSGSSDIAISLPTTGAYVNLSEDSLTIPASGYAEINIISDGSKLYIRTLA